MNYTFTDNAPVAKQYYRLRQADMDNHGKYSNIVLIHGDKPLILTIDGLFPNPANNMVNVLIYTPGHDKIMLLITDITGKTVQQLAGNIATGSNTIMMYISNLSQGAYTLKVISKTTGKSAEGSFIKQ